MSLPQGKLPDGTACDHQGELSTYCTRCWMNLHEARQPISQVKESDIRARNEEREDNWRTISGLLRYLPLRKFWDLFDD